MKTPASLQTSRQQQNPRNPQFYDLPLRQDAGVNPRVLLRHVEDAQQKRLPGLPFGFEPRFVHAVRGAENVGLVHLA